MRLVEYLSWDSTHFRRRIGRVLPHTLTQSELHSVLTWAIEEQIECLYYLVDADQTGAVHLAEQAGFQFMDIRVTLEKELLTTYTSQPSETMNMPHILIRGAQSSDLLDLENLAASSFTQSRFFADPHFTIASSAEMYRIWITKSYHSDKDTVLVADSGDLITGFVTLSTPPQKGMAKIELFGVHPEARGQGIGRHLLRNTLDWLRSNAYERVQVVTQGRNIPAQRLYQRGGFIISDLQLWFHKWFIE